MDVRLPNGQCLENVTRDQLLTLVQGQPVLVVLSFTRHQGFLLGRGNQQLGAELFERLKWPGDVMVLGSRTKLASLEHRPLLVDTGSPELDRELCGLVSVLTGYEDFLLYRVGTTLGG